MGGFLWQLGGLGHEAVVFFFVLSGYVISFVSADKENNASEYIINRVVRIYSVALPALILTVVLYYIGNYVNPEAFDSLNKRLINPITTIISAIFFVNQSWIGIPIFSNLPYWSLGYEVWYYVIFGVFIFMSGFKRIALVILCLIMMGPSVLLYLPIWLLGVFCYKAFQHIRTKKNVAYFLYLFSLFLIFFLCFGNTQKIINGYFHGLVGESFISMLNEPAEKFGADYLLGVAISMNIFSFAILGKNLVVFNTKVGTVIKLLASYTFSTYLYHMPILFFISAILPFKNNPAVNIVSCLVLTPLIIVLLGNVTEKKKHACKIIMLRFVKKLGFV
jgi:peptidoglycan/LPS O-acetylase OafA/YrhL